MFVLDDAGRVRALEARVGVRFGNAALPLAALTHRSYVMENVGAGADNQRLEFLGDALLGFVVGRMLYRDRPREPEGRLTALRAAVVNEASLAGLARAIELGPLLRLGVGAARTGSAERDGVLADAYEAVLGALLEDQGFEAAAAFVEARFSPLAAAADPAADNAPGTLQERLWRERRATPRYRDISGPVDDADPRFTVEVYAGDTLLAVGTARSRTKAKREAARAALAALG